MYVVYLDQLHWINLAKARAGMPDARHLRPFLDAAMKASAADRVRFPISSLHLMELGRIGQRRQREDVAEVMLDLGRGWVLPSQRDLVHPWLERSIRKLYGLGPCAVPDEVLTRGLLNAFGDLASATLAPMDTTVRALLLRFADTRAGWKDFLVNASEADRRRSAVGLKNLATIHTSSREKRRQSVRSYSSEIQHRIYHVELFDALQGEILKVMHRLGLEPRSLLVQKPGQAKQLLGNVPVLDVEIELTVAVERQWTRPLQPNDTYDIAALAAAIPYCDAVATEGLWASLGKQAGLDRRYGTLLCSKLTEIESRLN